MRLSQSSIRQASSRAVLVAMAAGGLLFAVGAALASAVLPEWRLDRLTDRETLLLNVREVAARAGLALGGKEPSCRLEISNDHAAQAYAELGEPAARWLADSRTAAFLVARTDLAGEAHQGERLEITFSAAGAPQRVHWTNLGASPMFGAPTRESEDLIWRFSQLLLGPGESAAKSEPAVGPGNFRGVDVAGAVAPAYLDIEASAPIEVGVARRLGTVGSALRRRGWSRVLVPLLTALTLLIAAAGLFSTLLFRSRIDLVNGFLLGLLTLASAHPEWLPSANVHWLFGTVHVLLAAPGRAFWVFLVWSAGESLLRTQHPDFTTSLDALRKGQVGPRAGRALLLGLAAGAALAGLQLALYAGAVALPEISPAGASLSVPIFSERGGPLGDGISLAAGVALALAIAGRFLPPRWILPATALVGGLLLTPVELQPWPAELAANVAVVGSLAWLGRRLGLTTLLTAAVACALLLAALYAGLHLDWLAGSFGLTAAMTAGIALVGLVGLARPLEVESRWVEPPAFIRRLEQERRVEHEMKLLGEMQANLLPKELPRVPGWQLAARSVFADDAGNIYDALTDDAGQLWLAAGDVAGRGYPCVIAQAMIKAGLASLVEPGESPARVLADLDRVLRTMEAERSHTTLTLVRLDPQSGRAVVANAGQPAALVVSQGRAREIAVSGLPLGQGSPRSYDEQEVVLPAGAALVLCSDGLFAALDGGGEAYGLSRVAEILALIDRRPAVEIVDTLLNDCRRHVGTQPLPDDLTVVVVQRSPSPS